jgi:hypothetical protein
VELAMALLTGSMAREEANTAEITEFCLLRAPESLQWIVSEASQPFPPDVLARDEHFAELRRHPS